MVEPVIWGIHAGKYGEADTLFNGGRIALGWEEIGDLSQLPPTRDAFKVVMRDVYPEASPGAVPVMAGQLFRFAHEAKIGDLVVWRSKSDQHQIRIGEIVGGYDYDPIGSKNYPHSRAIEWKAVATPKQLSQGALFELGAAMSFFSINNHAEEWLALLGKVPRPEPLPPSPDSDATIEPIAAQIEESTRDFILKTLSRELKGHPLSSFVAHILNAMGFQTRVSSPGVDQGVDIVAHKDALGFEPPITKVQVKSGDEKIGQPEVSALLGTLSPGEHGLMVALGGFTPPAKHLTLNKSNLRLVDGDELVALVLTHYESFDSRYKGLLPLKRIYVPDPDVDSP